MPSNIQITRLRFAPAPPHAHRSGLLGWLTFDLDGLRLDGVALRRTRDGRLTLSFPARHDAQHRQHHSVRPVDSESRLAIEAAVFAALGAFLPDMTQSEARGES